MSYAELRTDVYPNGTITCVPFWDTMANPNIVTRDIYLTFREGPVSDNETWMFTGYKNRTNWLSARVDLMNNFKLNTSFIEPVGVLPVLQLLEPPRQFPMVVGW